MKTVERFFRKYFLSMAGIIALFLLLNTVLFFSMLIWAWQTSAAPELSISEIGDRITLDGTGHLMAAGELAEMLEEHHAWAMVLDDTGTVIFQSIHDSRCGKIQPMVSGGLSGLCAGASPGAVGRGR
ncbi:MAG: hypothetical protein HFF10_10575 [Angelakisella sp.]|nr:hypothetical protein [Angelakisella sp.]